MNTTLPTADIEAAPGPTDAEIAAVRKYAELAVATAMNITRLEKELDNAQSLFKQTIEHDLPTSMIAARIETWPMPGGAHFDLTPIIGAGIPKDRIGNICAAIAKGLVEQGHLEANKELIQEILAEWQAHNDLSSYGEIGAQAARQFADIQKDRPLVFTDQNEAHVWLEDNGHGDLIKHEIKILFGRDDGSWYKKFMADCAKRKRPLDFSRRDWVDPNTLGAFVREQIRNAAAQGVPPEQAIPFKVFGVHTATVAKLVAPKARK